MLDQLSRLNSEHLTFLAVVAGMLMAVLSLVCGLLLVQIRKYRERQLELGFREELLRRGHSVDDVVRLLNPTRPSASQSLLSLGDRAAEKVSQAVRGISEVLPVVFRRCRKWWRHTCRQAGILCRNAWKRAQRDGRRLWRESRPYVRWGMKSISRCIGWLSDGLDNLARRLTPQRP